MSNTEENTPTTEEVRREWVQLRADGYALVIDDADSVAGAEFDRWLAEHDLQVAAKTLRDAADAWDFAGSFSTNPNPLPSRWLRSRAAAVGTVDPSDLTQP